MLLPRLPLPSAYLQSTRALSLTASHSSNICFPSTTATSNPRFSQPRRNTTGTASSLQPHRLARLQSTMAYDNKLFTREHLFDVTGKVALVTGGGSGIGLMATQALASNGAKVYITGRTSDKLERVADTYGKDIRGQIIPLAGDISTKDGVKALYDEFAKHEDCLCILVNNAGISSATLQTESETGSAQELRKNLFETDKSTYEDWQQTFNTNVTSHFFVTTAFLPLLQRSTEKHPGWSSTVINITSISGLVKSAQHHFAYNASKAAIEHLTRMLANEITAAGVKVRVNAIAPGVFPSEMTAGESDSKQKSKLDREKLEGKAPAARPGKDEDMASTVLFFATNQYLSGQSLAVDGGYTLTAGL
ncbi:hypothetical protein B0I35DRAFT_442464 [Stachybotrys elegans]|uniref:Rhamnolipids biosynthesis 3-oxoacyl-[acyl-carrier-protein] reductase n=1 Tax=Stachybotrys elegans TaxID=80388 RepID=A0A8K0SGM3_9HYPO|nr:hypothetical protein B0I35DRAFT_442464 [Stachybotrys elegans]